MSTFQMEITCCTCCQAPLELCPYVPDVFTYEVYTPPLEDVSADVNRMVDGA